MTRLTVTCGWRFAVIVFVGCVVVLGCVVGLWYCAVVLGGLFCLRLCEFGF